MNLLFDHNLSLNLVARLADVFPESSHVFSLDLHQKDDLEIWQFALLHELTIVTKDADFSDLSTLLGFPPKVIWIRRGNL